MGCEPGFIRGRPCDRARLRDWSAGAERVVVSQLHRSPGIAFESTVHVNGKVLYSFRIIPDRGSWIEVQFDTSDLLYIYLDRRKRRRKLQRRRWRWQSASTE